MRILMLHGSRQSCELFRIKTAALQRAIQRTLAPNQRDAVDFVYPSAPFELEPTKNKNDGQIPKVRDDHGSWAWWQSDSTEAGFTGLEVGLQAIVSALGNSGPFDGIIGFSQGGAAAAMIASLLENKRKDAFGRLEADGGIPYPLASTTPGHPPLKFVVSFSGYAPSHPSYRAFYQPRIRTPVLHVIGSLDDVVDENASGRLVECCEGTNGDGRSMAISHPGGHVIPSGKRETAVIVHFIKSCIEREAGTG